MGMLGAPFRVSPFSFLRLDSCREQATKKTPDEEFLRKFIGEPPRLEDPDTPSPREKLR
jgi:hypothetical protein